MAHTRAIPPARIEEDLHAYAYIAHTIGGEALLDSQPPKLDLTGMLVDGLAPLRRAAGRQASVAARSAVLRRTQNSLPSGSPETGY